MDLMLASEVRDYIVEVFKRTDKDDMLYEAITDTIIDMRNRYPFDEFKYEAYSSALSTLGDYKLDLPSELGHFIGQIKIVDGTNVYPPLIKISKEQYDRKYPNQATTDNRGTPKFFCIFGSQILLAPVPDTISYLYELSYSEELYYEYTGTDVSAYVPFTDNYREVLRFGVLMRLYSNLDDDNSMAKWSALYEEGLRKMIKRDYKNTYAPGFVAYNDI